VPPHKLEREPWELICKKGNLLCTAATMMTLHHGTTFLEALTRRHSDHFMTTDLEKSHLEVVVFEIPFTIALSEALSPRRGRCF
jgi:hypothetical protein